MLCFVTLVHLIPQLIDHRIKALSPGSQDRELAGSWDTKRWIAERGPSNSSFWKELCVTPAYVMT